MKELYEYLINHMKSGHIEKQCTFDIIKMLKKSELTNKLPNGEIAIIGMAVRVPKAESVGEFWDIIANRVDCISDFPKTRREDIDAYLDFTRTSDPKEPVYFQSAYLNEIDKFDYKYFNLTPREASIMDPAQRIFLEVAWQAIEDAGYGGGKLYGSNTGVFVGFAGNVKDLYARLISDINPELLSISMTGNLSAIIPSRLSYLLDFKGPSMVVDTACSSSMVCLDLACQALNSGKCDYAIVGGINIDIVPIDEAYTHIGIESSDNRSRAFDDHSDGSGIGEGVITLLLKPLQKARADRDHIYAVIKGSAVNQDGASSGLSAPNPAAQAAVLKQAWENAGINPASITYIETHGTATNLGDPIEVKGINDALRSYTQKKQFCAISSVKTNIGHLCEASGLASVVKAVLALRKKQLPPSSYFNKPNSSIPFMNSAVYVNTRLREWTTEEDGPRLCGISSFGISGTNCHVVLEEAMDLKDTSAPLMPYQLLCLSARTEAGVRILIRNFHDFLLQNPDISLQDICYTANTGRGHYEYRLAIIGDSRADLLTKLEACLRGQEGDMEYMFRSVCKPRGFMSDRNSSFDPKGEVLSVQEPDLNCLQKLCRKYIAGEHIPWEDLYRGCKPYKVPLPQYPFEPLRCWIDIPGRKDRLNDLNALYHKPCWLEKESKTAEGLKDGLIVLLVNQEPDELSKDFIRLLKEQGREIILAYQGEAYRKLSVGEYLIRHREEDYFALFSELSGKKITYIVHLSTLSIGKAAESMEELRRNHEAGALSLFYLVRALVQYGFEQDMKLLLVSREVHILRPEENIIPENATFFGLSKVIHLELPGIFCKGVDIDRDTPAQAIFNELCSMHTDRQVAYRNHKRYIESFTAFDLEDLEDRPVKVEAGSVYLITGGMGGIGLVLARYLARKAPIKLILIGRTDLPPREEWEEPARSQAYSDKISKCIRTIKEIEGSGASVEYYCSDISDYDRMKTILEEVRQRFGNIRGVFHCAGVPGGGVLIRRSLKQIHEVFDPKIFGTWVLDRLIPAEHLDFFVLFSSGQSILSEPGNGDYTAANAYMDAFAEYRNMQGKTALAIDWVSWKETGMSVVHGFNRDTIFKALSDREALAALEKAMSKKISRLLIGQFNSNPEFFYMLNWATFKLPDSIEKYVSAHKGKTEKKKAIADDHAVIELKGKAAGEITEVERRVARIYYQVLGLEEINVNDSFFELGGDSIMLNYMYSLLQEEFPNRIKLIDVFTYTSIASMSEFINRGEPKKTSKKKERDGEAIEDYLSILKEIKTGELNLEAAVESIIEK